MSKLRVFEAFSGYGSQSIALRNIGVDYEVVAISEVDKYAIQAYEAVHGEVDNLGDITKINPRDIPDHDLFTYSFPCQDISVAGKLGGIEKGQTRSGLLYECEKIIETCRPKYLLMENVKNLVSKKFKSQFEDWLAYLNELGYTNYWQVLNAKDFGIPQNRERVFVISILGEHEPYKFPEVQTLTTRLKDLLEESVDEKYYLKNTKEFFVRNNFKMESVKSDKEKLELSSKNEELRPERLGGVFDTDKSRHQAGSVYDTGGLSPTLDTGQGVWRQPCIIEEQKVLKVPQATKGGYIDMDLPGIADLSYPNSKTRRGRVQERGQVSPCIAATQQDICFVEYRGEPVELPCIGASRGRNPEKPTSREAGLPTEQMLELNINGTSNSLTTVQKDNYVVEPRINYNEDVLRIRKLTPRECFRLMGMCDTDIDKIQNAGISNTQQYKMAGNSIVVHVLEAIFKQLFNK